MSLCRVPSSASPTLRPLWAAPPRPGLVKTSPGVRVWQGSAQRSPVRPPTAVPSCPTSVDLLTQAPPHRVTRCVIAKGMSGFLHVYSIPDAVQVVTIYGKNFGPLGTPVTAVYDAGAVVSSVVAVSSSALTYPPLQPLSPSDYAVYLNNGQLVVFPAMLCNVIVAHAALNCTTSPGAGTGLNWVITVGNQTSQSPVTAYTPPSITSTTLVGSSGMSIHSFARVSIAACCWDVSPVG